VVDLARRISIGTPVTVVNRLPPQLERAVADQVRNGAMRDGALPTGRDPTGAVPAGEGAGGRERRPS
jgi:hypothetical protein